MPDLTESIQQYATQVQMHWAGTLTTAALCRMEEYLRTLSSDKQICTVETGCGASTILFAHYAAHHTAYCYDDRSRTNSSVGYAQNFPGFRREHVAWIYGPTQRTIFAQPLDHLVDVIFIDGPHGYPFPELEYFAFYRWLKAGGLLIVDDVHIPTIHHLYRFLLQDDSFRSLGLAETTAFFQRTETPAFNMEGDDWWLQRYNVQSFPMMPPSASGKGVELPVSIVFDQSLATGAPYLTRGFSIRNGSAVSEGSTSTVQLKLDGRISEALRIQLDIEPVSVEEREGCGVTVVVNGIEVGNWIFDCPGRRSLDLKVDMNGADALTMDFQNHGLKVGNELTNWEKVTPYDGQMPNFWLHAITITDDGRAEEATTLHRADGSIVTFNYEGKQFSFFVDQTDDPIAHTHSVGHFYKSEVLEALRTKVASGAAILALGAKSGNDTIYFDRVMEARRIIAIEPNPRLAFLLRTNCALNNARGVDLSHVTKPLSDAHQLFKNEKFDLIKIDATRVELQNQVALAEAVKLNHPLMSIEVNNANRDAVVDRLEAWDFNVIWESQSALGGSELLLAPRATARSWRNIFRPLKQLSVQARRV